MSKLLMFLVLFKGIVGIAQNGCVDRSIRQELLTAFFDHPHVSKNYVHAELPERVPLTFYRSKYFTDEFDLELYGEPVVLVCSKENPNLIDIELLQVDCDLPSFTINAYFKSENASVTARLIQDNSCNYKVEILKEVEY